MTSTSRQRLAVAAVLAIYAVLGCRQVVAGEIHDAVRINDLKAVKALLAHDPALLHSRDHDRMTPLHVAVRYGDAEMVKFFIVHGET